MIATNKEYKKHYFKEKDYKARFLKCPKCYSKVYFNASYFECVNCSYEF